MKIYVKVKTGARNESVEQIALEDYLVSVTERPVDGRANEAVIEALSLHFNIAPSNIRLLSGGKSRHKIFEILQVK
ncbi:MAG: hypothetical protein UY65_C0033G0010 [Parcubacteria group bacterium GW2011_GWA2_51_12]|nr:MAG: hypothetical protein UY65_C0033G0010 [Parcubacteria group bacterium GW2011_GWA2_51_12]